MQKPTLRFGELNIPVAIIEAFKQGRLVVFAGAGVSMGAPTNLMNFEDLTQLIITSSKERTPSDLATQIQNLDIDDDLKNQLKHAAWKAQYRSPEERLGEAQDSGRIDIKAQCLHHLQDDNLEPNHLHNQIIRLFANNPVRIITTNFERMLQKAAQSQGKEINTISIAPNLPQGDVIDGIVHLHGSLADKESIILSDRDFGKAYLTEGWARRFITRVFSQYTVLFIGYSYNDTIMKYLARSTSQNSEQKLFGISSVTADNQETEARRWELLGINHIPYLAPNHNHQALNTGIEALADCLNWNFSEQQNQLKQLVQEIEQRPENLLETDWQYLHYFYSNPALLNFFLKQIQHPAWPNILEALQNRYPQAQILLQENTAFILLNRFWYQASPTMLRLFQKHYANADSCRTVLAAFNQALQNKMDLEIHVIQQWLHLLIPHIDIFEYNHVFLIEPTSTNIAPFLLQHGCHQELESIFKQLLIIHTHFDSLNPKNTTFQYNIDEHSLEDLLHSNSSFMQLHPTSILDTCIQTLKQHSHLLDIFSIPDQSRYDSPSSIQYYKPCIWQASNGYPSTEEKIAAQLIDACYHSLMHPEMPLANRWTWASEYLSQKHVLLQKLALYVITHHPDYSADEKFTLISKTINIHELDFHAEMFDYFEHCLVDLSDTHIQTIIDSLHTYHDQNNGHCEWWAFWLKKCHDSHPTIDGYYQQQKQLHPQYQLPNDTYRNIVIGEARWINHHSPYSSEELLARQDATWFDTLLTYNQKSWDYSEPDTEGLWQQITETCQTNLIWAMAFIKYAIDTQQNTARLNQLISKFSQWQFTDLNQWNTCFDYFNTVSIEEHSALLCHLIDQTHRNEFFKQHPDVVTSPNQLVGALIQNQGISGQRNIFSTYYAFKGHADAYNSNIGYITNYLIMAFAKSIQAENSANQTQAFNLIESLLNTDTSGHVIHLLMTEYGFFEHHQQNFAHQTLLSYLNVSHLQHHLAWSGFLLSNRLNADTYRIIESDLKVLLKSPKPQDSTLSDFDSQCLRLYLWSIALGYHADAITSMNWLFKLNSLPLSKNVTEILKDILQTKYSNEATDSWQEIPDWMIQYWSQRSNGLGEKLDATEYEHLWTLSVNSPDWMPQIYEYLSHSEKFHNHAYWLHLLNKKQTQLKPQDMDKWAQLLNRYLTLPPSFPYLSGSRLDFISFILKQDIEETTKQAIRETLSKNGVEITTTN